MTGSKRPKISIVTVCYNESAENIHCTFDSISSQSYADREWIVIDGGSEPRTVSEIKCYEGQLDRLVSEPDGGTYDAMNKGVSLATGDFVVFMNTGDRYYSTDTLERVADFIVANPDYDCYYGGAEYVEPGGGRRVIYYPLKVSRYSLYSSGICHQTVLARRSLFDQAGGFDTSYRIVADKDWILKTLCFGARWIYTGLDICLFDATGCSTNVEKVQAENARLLRNRYSRIERCCYPLAYRVAERFRGAARRTRGLLCR